ncbi:helix-turn-helix transcriptional regulator [Candidatus Woesearchaeota archaeon]|nr:helix-turn-helix transcriptional regulator [Candidatus Woesearchaeota archaeon]
MEQETLFTASKWDILKILSSGSKSPLQLAKLSNTSVANISQQLRLLEMAGLVQSKRISNRDKGQPRLLYSLVGNHSFLIASAQDFVDKKLLKLSEYNKVILKIWFLDNPAIHYFLEKAFWQIEASMTEKDSLVYDPTSSDEISLIIISDNPSLKKEFRKMAVKNSEGISKTVTFNVKTFAEFKKLGAAQAKLYALYDPSNILNQRRGEDLRDKN